MEPINTHSPHLTQVRVEWMNTDQETGQPYDIRVIGHTSPANGCESVEESVLAHVEVKSTLLNERKGFEISSQQIKFAMEQGSKFHLYRVSGVLEQSKLRIRKLQNLDYYLTSKSVKLYLVL